MNLFAVSEVTTGNNNELFVCVFIKQMNSISISFLHGEAVKPSLLCSNDFRWGYITEVSHNISRFITFLKMSPTHGFVFTCTAAWVSLYILACGSWDLSFTPGECAGPRCNYCMFLKPEATSVWSLIKQTSLVLIKWTFKC